MEFKLKAWQLFIWKDERWVPEWIYESDTQLGESLQQWAISIDATTDATRRHPGHQLQWVYDGRRIKACDFPKDLRMIQLPESSTSALRMTEIDPSD